MARIVAGLFLLFLTVGAAAQSGVPGPVGPAGPPGILITNPPGSTPVPDPTKLTQEAVDRAIAQVTALFGVQLQAITARLDRIQIDLDARPKHVEEIVNAAINNLLELVLQKFTGVDQQFEGRDTALAAALLAQKTAVDEQNRANALSIAKSDAATTKQIDTIALNIDSKTSAINEKVDDLRTRVQAIESRAIGVNDNQDNTAAMYSIIFGVIGAVGVLFGIGVLFVRASQPKHTGA